MKSTDGQFWRPEAAETLLSNDNIARIANAVPLFKGHYECWDGYCLLITCAKGHKFLRVLYGSVFFFKHA